MHLNNGSLSAILFPEDVRKEDIVEYSYTLKGCNPVFKGELARIFETGFFVPVYNLTDKVMEESNSAKKNTGYVISLVVALIGVTLW